MPALMDLAGFALAVLLIELTPGPNMGWLVALTLSEGRKSGLAAVTGIALGLAANAVLSVIAASFILQQSDVLAQGIAVLGAAMMFYLAWQTRKETGETSAATTPKHFANRNFVAGFVINLLNPKATLFFITVMPQFVPSGRPTYFEGLTMAAISVAIATAIHLALILGAERIRPLIMSGKHTRMVRYVLAAGMVAVGLWFLFKAFA